MVKYLLDTVVVSEMRKRTGHPGVEGWLREKPDEELFLSAITIGEIERGIAQIRAANPAFAEDLASWLEQLIDLYRDHVLPVDTAVARRWGRLAGRFGHSGSDLLLAATALEHGLTVVTRNLRHFLPTGVALENPFNDA